MTVPHDRIEAALARLGAEHEPPAGWEARVLAAVRAEQTRRPWWRPWWRIAVPALTLATAAAAAVFLFVSRPRPFELAVAAETPGRVRMLGGVEDRAVGDVAHVAVSGGAGWRAIRVYRNETELMMTCPGSPACQVSGDGIAVDVALDKVGDYRIVAISSQEALAMPRTYDADTAAAIQAHAMLHERRLRVR